MDINDVKQVLRGPMIPELSCFDSTLAVDHGATRANVQTTIERGIVNGRGVLLAVGAGGDFPMLSLDERRDISRTDSSRFRVSVQRTKPTGYFTCRSS